MVNASLREAFDNVARPRAATEAVLATSIAEASVNDILSRELTERRIELVVSGISLYKRGRKIFTNAGYGESMEEGQVSPAIQDFREPRGGTPKRKSPWTQDLKNGNSRYQDSTAV